ncbi:MAG: SusC/RagA family TonB-linked outer membrane protein, partial [Bacteroidaceae bacterium]|nr:SusC/RagA family TonB-linked outer membrane protein [Bacteroidaceae bacterium]
SIYGARAMAGVVVITTKRGKAGKSTINYTGEFTYRLKPSYNDYNICNSQEQMGIYKEMESKGWLEFSHLANGATSGLYGQMYNLMKTYDTTTGQFGLPNTEAAMNNYLREAEFRNTDWFDLLFKNNIVQNHSVSISTGTDKANLYASVSMLDDQGWTLDSKVQRFTANMNATFNLSKQLSVSILTKGNYRKQDAPGTLARETDVVSGTVSRSFDINPFSYAMNTSRTLDPNAIYKRNYADFNIFRELDNNYINLNVMDMMFHGETAYKPFLGLELKALVAYRTQRSTSEHFILNQSNQAEAYRAGVDDPNVMNDNIYLYKDPDKENSLPISVMPTGGIYTRTDNTVEQLDFRLSANYNKIWNDTHIFNAYLGMEVNKTEKEKIFHSDYGVDYDNGRLVTITPEFYKQAKEEGTELSYFTKSWTRNIAYFANLNYSYKGRYTLNATGRYEGTNKLGRSRSARWLPTWNIAAGWNAHEETFFKNFMENTNGKFSHFAMRASYSLTADRGPSSVSNALPIMRPANVWRPEAEQIETVINLVNIANSELTYEKKHELNIGFDAGFFNNRVNINFDIYWRNNYDLIGYIQTQGCGGVINKMANIATMKANGFDGTISTQNIKTKNFSWSTDFTFAYNHDKITNLKSRSTLLQLCSGTGSSHFREGYARSALFSIPFVRLTDEGIPVVLNEYGEETSTNINFQEYESLDYLKYEGPTEPTTTGGLNNTLRWKNWRMNIFVTYSFGNKVRLSRDFSAAYSDMSSMSKDFKNRWVQSGDENITSIPAIASKRQYISINHLSYAYNAYNYSTERVADAGFVRLKDVSLTYDVPKKLVRNIGLSNISLRLAATNLCLLYADKKLNGQDPEFMNSGGVATPLSRQFTFTLKLGI